MANWKDGTRDAYQQRRNTTQISLSCFLGTILHSHHHMAYPLGFAQSGMYAKRALCSNSKAIVFIDVTSTVWRPCEQRECKLTLITLRGLRRLESLKPYSRFEPIHATSPSNRKAYSFHSHKLSSNSLSRCSYIVNPTFSLNKSPVNILITRFGLFLPRPLTRSSS